VLDGHLQTTPLWPLGDFGSAERSVPQGGSPAGVQRDLTRCQVGKCSAEHSEVDTGRDLRFFAHRHPRKGSAGSSRLSAAASRLCGSGTSRLGQVVNRRGLGGEHLDRVVVRRQPLHGDVHAPCDECQPIREAVDTGGGVGTAGGRS
jgi:hypothetical protein